MPMRARGIWRGQSDGGRQQHDAGTHDKEIKAIHGSQPTDRLSVPGGRTKLGLVAPALLPAFASHDPHGLAPTGVEQHLHFVRHRTAAITFAQWGGHDRQRRPLLVYPVTQLSPSSKSSDDS